LPLVPSRRTGLLVALVLASIAMRPQLLGIGPLLPRIERDLSVSHTIAGLLVTIPIACAGLLVPVAAAVRSRIGWRQGITATIAIAGSVGLARALLPGVPTAILLSAPIGVTLTLAGALMPVAVAERLRDRPGFATGLYASGFNFGGAAAALVAVPLATIAGGWRGSLAVLAGIMLAVGALWVVLTRHEPVHAQPVERPPRLPLRSRIAWWLVAIFTVLAACFFGLNAWLADAYVEHGWSEASAGALIGVLNLVQIAGALIVPRLADRFGTRRTYLLVTAAVTTLSGAGLAGWPAAAWPCAVVFGISIGAFFALFLTVPLDLGTRPADVGALAAMILGIGYTLSAAAPFVLGAVRDATGSFSAALWAIVALAGLLVAMCLPLTPRRLRSRVLDARPSL
jgi:CP family cyanate transporter-like MFS transporter